MTSGVAGGLCGDVILKENTGKQVTELGFFDGVVNDFEPGDVTLTLLGAVNWTVVWWKPEGEGVDVLANRMTETFLGGLRKR